MKKLLTTAVAWLVFCCAVNAQSTYSQGAIVPSPAPFTGFALLAKSGTAASHTGDLLETALATITIPPNTLGANGQVRINSYWTVTNSATVKNIRIRLGGTGVSGTVVYSAAPTTIANVFTITMVINANATNSQLGFSGGARGTDGLFTTTSDTAAVDMTQSQILVFSGQDASATTDSIALSSYTIEVAF